MWPIEGKALLFNTLLRDHWRITLSMTFEQRAIRCQHLLLKRLDEGYEGK